MNKIPTLFARDAETNFRHVKNEVTPGCEWVLAGEGVATRKYDGTCVMFDGTSWWARREVKPGKSEPSNFQPLQTDEATGKTVGWEPADQSGFAKFLDEAIANDAGLGDMDPGTYELIGPKINGNPESVDRHVLEYHAAAEECDDAPRDFHGLRDWLHAHNFEGIVWHHEDGRMCKLKRRDFPSVPMRETP